MKLVSREVVEVKKYQVKHFTEGRYDPKKHSGNYPNEIFILAQIRCDNANAKEVGPVGVINFYPNDHVPTSSGPPIIKGASATASYVINFPISRIDEILDTLRQEKPVYIAFSNFEDPENGIGEVLTGENEPVGEEEGIVYPNGCTDFTNLFLLPVCSDFGAECKISRLQTWCRMTLSRVLYVGCIISLMLYITIFISSLVVMMYATP